MKKAAEEENRFADMLDLPRPVSSKHPPMTRLNRAAQFAPFAALTGYEAVIRETGRLTEKEVELSEDRKTELDEKLRQLREQISEAPEVTIIYFRPDERKAGGAYVTVTGRVRRIDEVRGMIILEDRREIRIDRVVSLDAACQSSCAY